MSAGIPARCLDLRGTPCPMNYVRARLALETLSPGSWLQVDLDPGEPEETVAESLRGDGHHVQREDPGAAADGTVVRLLIRRGG